MQEAPDLMTIVMLIIVNGVPATLQLTFFGLAAGFAIGLVLALMRVYGTKEMQWFATGYENTLRGIPLLVFIYIFVFGVPWVFWFVDAVSRPLFGVFFALGIRSGAYQSQIIRGAILSVGEGQVMAARALGMTAFQTQLYIVLPQAFKIALPSFANEYAVVIKDTSFAYSVGIFEILKVSRSVTAAWPALWVPSMLIVTVTYFVFTYPVTRYFGKKRKIHVSARGG